MQTKDFFKHAAPHRRKQQRHHAFENQHAGQGPPQGIGGHLAYFLGAAALGAPEPRIVLKNSDDGSITITSLFFEKLAL